MAEQDETEALLSVARAASAQRSLDATLQQVVDLAAEGIAGCVMAGITLLEPSGPTTAAATNPVAAEVDAIQYRAGAGPCLDSYRRQVVNRIDSTDHDERWPEFCTRAAAVGIRSVLSFPLVVNNDGMGALNLYSADPSGFDEQDERIGAVFAAHASVTLTNVRAFWQVEEVRRNLEQALDRRGVIDQAKGVLIARQGYSADEAFDVLRRASQRANRKVFDLAQEIVDRARRNSPGSGT